jgi:tripartite-type tricarboxylate transporter receptor subunit TctC
MMKSSVPKRIFMGLVVLTLIGLFAFLPNQATAKYPDPSKSITFIIPVSVGGGYDFYSRLLAPFLSDELDVRIKIRNVPGGKWLVGLDKIYKAKPDGYTIGIWNPGLMMNDKDVLGKVSYDMTTFTYLYRITNEPRVVIVKTDGPIKDFKDLMAKGKDPNFQLRCSYAGGTALLDAQLLDSEWGIKTEKIAYSSGSKTRLAVMRGDVHFCVSGLGSGMDAIPTGRVKFVMLLHDEPMTAVPEAKRWIKANPELKKVPIPVDLRLKPLSYSSKSARAIIAPPGLPADIKMTLENALEKIINNKDLRKLGERSDRPFGKGQSGDDYAAQMRKDKATLIKIKHLLQTD